MGINIINSMHVVGPAYARVSEFCSKINSCMPSSTNLQNYYCMPLCPMVTNITKKVRVGRVVQAVLVQAMTFRSL